MSVKGFIIFSFFSNSQYFSIHVYISLQHVSSRLLFIYRHNFDQSRSVKRSCGWHLLKYSSIMSYVRAIAKASVQWHMFRRSVLVHILCPRVMQKKPYAYKVRQLMHAFTCVQLMTVQDGRECGIVGCTMTLIIISLSLPLFEVINLLKPS